ncbi:MAG: FliA/WhiG family RNA polymerase sigma factor [Fimbriimonadaceae bacterium]|nr:FliA/WhiG family RNA polymerase sigma factor [Fimbriimonadaceae bacterium]
MPLAADQLPRAWIKFKVYKDERARLDIIDYYSYLVKITSGRLVANVPGGMDRDDLISAGVIGLIKSVDQYDPSRDVKFETYAIALIRGAILEMLRDEDWVPRSIREKLKALDRASQRLETQLGRAPKPIELADDLGMSEQEVSELMVRAGRTAVYSLDDMVGGGGGEGEDSIHLIEMLVDDTANPGGEVEGRDLKRILAGGVDKLPDRERLVVSLYYFEGLTFKEIGGVLGVSESRVYQLHTQAMGRLRNHMRDEGVAQVA